MKRLCFLVICMSIIMGCSTSTSSTKALVDYVDQTLELRIVVGSFIHRLLFRLAWQNWLLLPMRIWEIPVVGKQWGMIFVILPSKALPIFTSSR